MPHRDSSVLGAPCWIDLMSSEPDLVTPFYTGLFGWSSERSGEGSEDYVMFYLDGQAVGGMGTNTDETGMPDGWTLYFAVEDVDLTVASAQGAGGDVLIPPTTVGPEGRLAVITDPSGAAFGVWQSDQQGGLEVVGEPGAPVWFELNTRDIESVLPFYAEVFGWEYQPLEAEGMRYETAVVEGEQVCGLFDASEFLPNGVSSHWQTYLGTSDTDQTVQQAKEFGGQVSVEPFDSEYGRIAHITDPAGAVVPLCSIEASDEDEQPG